MANKTEKQEALERYPNPVSMRIPEDLRPRILQWMDENGIAKISKGMVGIIRLHLGTPKPAKTPKAKPAPPLVTELDGIFPVEGK